MRTFTLISSFFLVLAVTACSTNNPPTDDAKDVAPLVVQQACEPAVFENSFCSKPIGKPEAECASLGLTWTGVKDEGVATTTQSADVAIVKGGSKNCERGQSSYRVYVNVAAGTELATGNGTGVSHITYCACTNVPPPPPPPPPPPVPACGDGTLDDGEQCDDGNVVDNDGCSANCTTELPPPPPPPPPPVPVCGDGELDLGEECDDGNLVDGDECSSTCTNELPPPPPPPPPCDADAGPCSDS